MRIFVNFCYELFYLVKHLVSYLDVLNKLRPGLYFSKYKTSDTLFIFGSGSSILELGDKEWEYINKHDVLGFSHTSLLDKKMNFYFFEPDDYPGYNYNNINQIRIPYLINNRLVSSIILKDKSNDIEKFYKRVSGFQIIPEFTIVSDTIAEFESKVKIILKLHLERIFLIKKRATILSVVFFAIALKYKRIIFCGIDLNNCNYFFQDNPDFPLASKLKTGQEHLTVHKSLLKEYGTPIDELLKALIKSTNWIKYYTTSNNSKLAEFLSVFNFVDDRERII